MSSMTSTLRVDSAAAIVDQFCVKFFPGEHLLDPIRSVSFIGYARDAKAIRLHSSRRHPAPCAPRRQPRQSPMIAALLLNRQFYHCR